MLKVLYGTIHAKKRTFIFKSVESNNKLLKKIIKKIKIKKRPLYKAI